MSKAGIIRGATDKSGVKNGNINITSITGWSSYVDNEYTTGAPFTLTTGAGLVSMPNNAGVIIEDEKPTDIPSFYDGTKIIGQDGDAYAVQQLFKVRPTTASSDVRLYTSIDIGGAIGEIYKEDFIVNKGNGVEHSFSKFIGVYTLDTWEANGGTPKMQAFNSEVEIYDVIYNFIRLHKAGNQYTQDNAITSDMYKGLINSKLASETNAFVTQGQINIHEATKTVDEYVVDTGLDYSVIPDFLLINPSANNTDVSTIKIDDLTSVDLLRWDGTDLQPDDLIEDKPVLVLKQGSEYRCYGVGLGSSEVYGTTIQDPIIFDVDTVTDAIVSTDTTLELSSTGHAENKHVTKVFKLAIADTIIVDFSEDWEDDIVDAITFIPNKVNTLYISYLNGVVSASNFVTQGDVAPFDPILSSANIEHFRAQDAVDSTNITVTGRNAGYVLSSATYTKPVVNAGALEFSTDKAIKTTSAADIFSNFSPDNRTGQIHTVVSMPSTANAVTFFDFFNSAQLSQTLLRATFDQTGIQHKVLMRGNAAVLVNEAITGTATATKKVISLVLKTGNLVDFYVNGVLSEADVDTSTVGLATMDTFILGANSSGVFFTYSWYEAILQNDSTTDFANCVDYLKTAHGIA